MRTTVLTVPVAEADLAADRLWAAGAGAVEERTVSRVEAAEQVELITVLSADDDVSIRRLGSIPAHWRVAFVDVDPAPAESWRDHARPIAIGDDLVICPSWLQRASAPADVVEVSIEPAGSFGLGDHPTTRLSAAAVRHGVRPGDRVLDVGCGSGVLAIVAARFGAARVVAIDMSPAAVEATRANVEANDVVDRVEIGLEPLAAVEETFDLVVANILAPTLVTLAPELLRTTAPSGRLVVSGVLADAHDHVVAALRPMSVVSTTVLDGWAVVELRHRHPHTAT